MTSAREMMANALHPQPEQPKTVREEKLAYLQLMRSQIATCIRNQTDPYLYMRTVTGDVTYGTLSWYEMWDEELLSVQKEWTGHLLNAINFPGGDEKGLADARAILTPVELLLKERGVPFTPADDYVPVVIETPAPPHDPSRGRDQEQGEG